jgi:opacity protein-like surface antigen
MHTRTGWIVPILLLVGLLAVPSSAAADITAFLGVNPTPTNRAVKGFSIGTGLLIVGFEFEYAHSNEDITEGSPSLRTFMFNGLVQTPVPIAGMQFYGTAGGGVYRETLNDNSETNAGVNLGGGVKMTLIGPLRLRLDYRVTTLKGDARYPRPQRFYAGVNVKF